MTEIARGRQFELPDPPAPEAEPSERPFGLMLRRPGDVPNPAAEFGAEDEHEGIYLAPDFTERHDWSSTRAGSDPRWGTDKAEQWALSLPHRCGEWEIWDGPRADVLAAAYRFRAELDGAIAAMEAADD